VLGEDTDRAKDSLDYLKYTSLKSSVDSLKDKFASDKFISLEAAKEAQKLYNTSFSSMQTSFNIFVGALSVMVLISGWFNFKNTSDLKKEAKEEKKEAKEDLEKTTAKFEKKIEEISSTSRTLHEKMIMQHEKMDKMLKEFSENMDQKITYYFMESRTNIKDEKDRKKKEALKNEAINVINNPNASPYDKALAEAAIHYYSDEYDSTLRSYKNILKNYGNEITLTRLSQIYFHMAYSYTEIKWKDEKEKEELSEKAMNKYKEALKWNPKNAKASYNIACLYAEKYGLTRNPLDEKEAFRYLKEALENKENDEDFSFDYAENDPDFKALNKNDPQYKELKDKYG
jgi:tetratricopeptide (TPR) repeat protein